jgi:excisionase family DNA binding protein
MNNSALVHSIPEACSIACVGRTALYEAINPGALRAVKRGSHTLILAEDLRRYMQSLPSVAVKQSGAVSSKGSVTGHNDGGNDASEKSGALELRRVA